MPARTALKLTRKTKPKAALDLPAGHVTTAMLGGVPVLGTPTPEMTVEAAKFIISKGGHDEEFYSQASIINFAREKCGEMSSKSK